MQVDDTPAAWQEVLRQPHIGAVVLVSLGIWLHAADSLIVATMMPAIVAEIGGGRVVSWAFALYETGTIVAGAASGLLALRHGLRLPMAAAALVFALGCTLSAMAPTMPVLLAGRLAQGAGGGGLAALSFVAVGLLFPRRLMPRAMAVMSILWGAAAFAGPLIGSLFVAYASWRAGFAFFGAQALLLALWIGWWVSGLATPGPGRTGDERLPIKRLALLCLSILLVSYAGIAPNPSTMALALLAGLAALLLFARIDAAAGAGRLWPARPFDLRFPVGSALLMTLGACIATMGLVTYGPILMQVLHASPVIVSGYVIATVSIAWTLGSVMVSGLPERLDPLVIGIGMAMVFASVAGMTYAMPAGPIWLIAAFAAVEGFGYGIANVFVLRRATLLAPRDDVERLSAALPTVGHLGYALGAAVVGILANSAGFHDALGAGEAAHVARWIFGGSFAVALGGALAMLRFVTFRK
ncbi:MAG: MFS transporter [Rhodobacteraceae bacterium]|nr:MFS transporter [Paracoccaceae bacterium]